MFGWRVIDNNPSQYEFNLNKSGSGKNLKSESIKSQIESALESCLRKVDRLTGLAKYAGLMGKTLRCQPSQRLALIEQAREEAEKILTLAYPEFSSGLFINIAIACDSLDLSQKALDSCNKAIELKPDYYGAWHTQGNALRKLERHEEALDSYDKAIALKPDYYGAWNNRGLVLRKLERHEEALNSCDKAIALKPDYYGAWNNRGNALEELERYEEALASYDKATELEPDYYGAWNNRGNVLKELERYEEALASLDRALQITKDSAGIWNLRSLCLSFLKQYEEALKSISKARDLDKEEPLFLANQGIVLARAGRYEEAIALCEQALNLKENEGGHYGKACCYALQGRDELAIEALRQAMKYAPRRCYLEAKYNPDFDRLRHNEQFQALMAANGKKT